MDRRQRERHRHGRHPRRPLAGDQDHQHEDGGERQLQQEAGAFPHPLADGGVGELHLLPAAGPRHHGRGQHRACHLPDPVADEIGEVALLEECPQGHRRVEVPAGYVPHRVIRRQQAEPEAKGNDDHRRDARESRRQDGQRADEHQDEGADQLGQVFVDDHVLLLFRRPRFDSRGRGNVSLPLPAPPYSEPARQRRKSRRRFAGWQCC